jgi:ankyrin repeat protein
MVRFLPLLALGFACCAPAFAQVAPTAAEYAGYKGLFQAAARGDAIRITQLLNGGEYAGVRDSRGRTPLHVATWRKRQDAMRLLAAATGDPNVLDGDGYDIASIAASASDVDTLQVALKIGCSAMNTVGPDGSSALIIAARRGSETTLRALLGGGARPDHTDRLGNTALIAAVTAGDGSKRYVAVVKLLVAAGANTSLEDRSGATALALAKARGQREIVAILEKARPIQAPGSRA